MAGFDLASGASTRMRLFAARDMSLQTTLYKPTAGVELVSRRPGHRHAYEDPSSPVVLAVPH
jgi:hypothetical protein